MKLETQNRRLETIVLELAARDEASVWTRVNDRNPADVLGAIERVVTMSAEDQVDARNASRKRAIERESDMGEHDQQIAVGNFARVWLQRAPRIEKSPAEDALPGASDAILHDQEPENVDAYRTPVLAGGLETKRRQKGQRSSFGILQVRADQRVTHSQRTRPQQSEEIMKLAISNRLRVVTGRVHLSDDRLAAMVHALASPQRVAAIEEQSRPLLAQRPQRSYDAAAIVKIGGMIDANHAAFARASSTA